MSSYFIIFYPSFRDIKGIKGGYKYNIYLDTLWGHPHRLLRLVKTTVWPSSKTKTNSSPVMISLRLSCNCSTELSRCVFTPLFCFGKRNVSVACPETLLWPLHQEVRPGSKAFHPCIDCEMDWNCRFHPGVGLAHILHFSLSSYCQRSILGGGPADLLMKCFSLLIASILSIVQSSL